MPGHAHYRASPIKFGIPVPHTWQHQRHSVTETVTVLQLQGLPSAHSGTWHAESTAACQCSVKLRIAQGTLQFG